MEEVSADMGGVKDNSWGWWIWSKYIVQNSQRINKNTYYIEDLVFSSGD